MSYNTELAKVELAIKNKTDKERNFGLETYRDYLKKELKRK